MRDRGIETERMKSKAKRKERGEWKEERGENTE